MGDPKPLYDVLKRDKLYTKDFDSFLKDYGSKESRAWLHAKLVETEYVDKDVNQDKWISDWFGSTEQAPKPKAKPTGKTPTIPQIPRQEPQVPGSPVPQTPETPKGQAPTPPEEKKVAPEWEQGYKKNMWEQDAFTLSADLASQKAYEAITAKRNGDLQTLATDRLKLSAYDQARLEQSRTPLEAGYAEGREGQATIARYETELTALQTDNSLVARAIPFVERKIMDKYGPDYMKDHESNIQQLETLAEKIRKSQPKPETIKRYEELRLDLIKFNTTPEVLKYGEAAKVLEAEAAKIKKAEAKVIERYNDVFYEEYEYMIQRVSDIDNAIRQGQKVDDYDIELAKKYSVQIERFSTDPYVLEYQSLIDNYNSQLESVQTMRRSVEETFGSGFEAQQKGKVAEINRIISKAQNVSEEDMQQYQSLYSKVQAFQEDPSIKELYGMSTLYEKQRDKALNLLKEERFQTVADVFWTKQSAQEYQDKISKNTPSAFMMLMAPGTKDVLANRYTPNIAMRAIGRFLSSIGGTMQIMENAFGTNEEYGKSDAIAEYLRGFGKDADLLFTKPTSASRAMITNTAKWNFDNRNYQVDFDDNGNIESIRDINGYIVDTPLSRELEKEIKALPRVNQTNISTMPWTIADVGADLITLRMAGGIGATGLTAAGMSAKHAGAMATTMAVAGQMSATLYDQGLEIFDGDKQKAARFAGISAIGIGLLSTTIGVDAIAAGSKRLISPALRFSKTDLKTLYQGMTPTQASSRYLTQMATAGGMEFADEYSEQFVTSGVSALMGGETQFAGWRENLETLAVSFIVGAGVEPTQFASKNEMRDMALLNASQNPEKYATALDKLIDNGWTPFGVEGPAGLGGLEKSEFVARERAKFQRLGAQIEVLSKNLEEEQKLGLIRLLEQRDNIQRTIEVRKAAGMNATPEEMVDVEKRINDFLGKEVYKHPPKPASVEGVPALPAPETPQIAGALPARAESVERALPARAESAEQALPARAEETEQQEQQVEQTTEQVPVEETQKGSKEKRAKQEKRQLHPQTPLDEAVGKRAVKYNRVGRVRKQENTYYLETPQGEMYEIGKEGTIDENDLTVFEDRRLNFVSDSEVYIDGKDEPHQYAGVNKNQNNEIVSLNLVAPDGRTITIRDKDFANQVFEQRTGFVQAEERNKQAEVVGKKIDSVKERLSSIEGDIAEAREKVTQKVSASNRKRSKIWEENLAKLEQEKNQLNERLNELLEESKSIKQAAEPTPQAVATEVAPQAVAPEAAPQAVAPEAAPQAVAPEAAPQAVAPEAAPQAVTPEAAPQAVTPEAAPQAVAPEAAPQAVTPEAAPQAVTPEPTPQAVAPEVAPEVVEMEAAPEITPEVEVFQPASVESKVMAQDIPKKADELVKDIEAHLKKNNIEYEGIEVGAIGRFNLLKESIKKAKELNDQAAIDSMLPLVRKVYDQIVNTEFTPTEKILAQADKIIEQETKPEEPEITESAAPALTTGFQQKYGVTYDEVMAKVEEGKNIGIDPETYLSNEYRDQVEDFDAFVRDFQREMLSRPLPKKLPTKKEKFYGGDELGEVQIAPISVSVKKAPVKTSDEKAQTLTEIVSNDDLRPAFTGVFYSKEDKQVVATNAFVLVAIDAPDVKETKLIHPKTNQTIDQEYPDYKAIMPENPPVKRQINVQELLNKVAAIGRASKFFNNKKPIAALFKFGDIDIYANPEFIQKVMAVFAKHGVENVSMEVAAPNTPIVFKAPGITAIVMPVLGDSEQTHTVVYSTELTQEDKLAINEAQIKKIDRGIEYHKKEIERYEKQKDQEHLIEYHQEKIKEFEAEKEQLVAPPDNQLLEKEDINNINQSIEDGTITKEQVTEFLGQPIERSGEVESAVADIESKAESPTDAQQAIREADRLIAIASTKPSEQSSPEAPENLAKGFDFEKLFAEQGDETLQQKEKDDFLEENYQKSSFDKKWAKTYKEAKQKLIDQYNNARQTKEKWQAKTYKTAGGKTTFVGGELEGNEVSIDRINQNRKKNAIKNAESEMESVKKDLAALGLTNKEIEIVLQEQVSPVATLSKEEAQPGADEKASVEQSFKDKTLQAEKELGQALAAYRAKKKELESRENPSNEPAELEPYKQRVESAKNDVQALRKQTTRTDAEDAANKHSKGNLGNDPNIKVTELGFAFPKGFGIALDKILPTTTQIKIRRFLENIAKYTFSPKGFMNNYLFKRNEDRINSISAQMKRAAFINRRLNKAIKDYAKKMKISEDVIRADVNEMLKDPRFVEMDVAFVFSKNVNEEIVQAAKEMRSHIDTLSKELIAIGVADGSLALTITDNLGTYLTRSYQVHDDKMWLEKVKEQPAWAAAAVWYKNEVAAEMADAMEAKELYANMLRQAIEMYETATSKAVKKKATRFMLHWRAKIQVTEEAYVKLQEIYDNKNGQLTARLEVMVKEQMEGAGGGPANKSKLGSKDLGIFAKRKDIPKEIRDLFGEYQDPGVNYMKSIFKMIHLIENHKFLRDVEVEGITEGWLSIDPVEGMTEKIASEGSKVMEPLNGYYTNEHLKKAFEEAGTSVSEYMGPILQAWASIMAIPKITKTLFSHVTQITNFVSNQWLMWMNGHYTFLPLDMGKALNNTARPEFQEAWDLALMEAGIKSNTKERESKIVDLYERGVLGQSITFGEIQDTLNAMKGFRDRFFKGDKYDATMNKGEAFFEVVKDLYQFGDNFWKILMYSMEINRMAKLHKGDKFENLTLDQQEEIKNMAAKRAQNQVMNYRRVPRNVRLLGLALPVGTFVSFPWEAVRTTKHAMFNMVEDMTTQTNYKVAGVPYNVAVGLKRALGFGFSTVGAYAMQSMSFSFFGFDDEDRDKMGAFLPTWDSEAVLFALTKPVNGKFSYINLSRQMPHGYPLQVISVLSNPNTSASEKANKLWDTATQPFFSLDIASEAAYEVITNRDIVSGEKIVAEGEETNLWFENRGGLPVPVGTGNWKRAALLYKAFEPGSITSARRLIKAFTEPELKHAGKLNWDTEVISNTTGTRVVPVDINTSFRFISNGLRDDKVRADNIYKLETKKQIYETLSPKDAEARLQPYKLNAEIAFAKVGEKALKLYQDGLSLGGDPAYFEERLKTAGFTIAQIEDIKAGIVPSPTYGQTVAKKGKGRFGRGGGFSK
jgi:ribosomal protein S17E